MRVLAGVFVVSFLVALVAAVLLIDEGALDGERELLVPTATATAEPAASVDPSGLGMPAPTPTPSRTAFGQTVLIDLESGRSVPLTPPGERSGSIAFSPDGRWLVYYARHGSLESPSYDIYRVDLASTGLQAEHFYEGGSFGRLVYPSVFSSMGDLAFFDRDDDGESRPAVMRPDGSVHRLANEGHITSWSPDGRWLTYEEPYREDADGNEIPIAQYLVDTETWGERKIGESGACHCDGNPRPVWAPDSSKFIYTYLVGEIPNGHAVAEVHFPDGRAPIEIEDRRGWLDSERYIARVYDEDSYDIVAIDLDTGARTLLFEDNPRGRTLWMSPTNDLFFADGTLLNSNGDVVASVPGGFRRWSPDGQHVITFSHGTSCGRGYRVQTTDGELIGCGPYPEEGSPFEFDVQNDAFAYIVPGYLPELDRFLVNAYILDFATREHKVIVEDLIAASRCIELSPDSRFVVIGHACGL